MIQDIWKQTQGKVNSSFFMCRTSLCLYSAIPKGQSMLGRIVTAVSTTFTDKITIELLDCSASETAL